MTEGENFETVEFRFLLKAVPGENRAYFVVDR